jgi:hypothetical protein
MPFDPPTPEDLETVSDQIGRQPIGVVGIAARCGRGHPCVVVNYPVRKVVGDLVPFPTLFWLTCPQLNKSVSRLEMSGLIGDLDRRLAEDAALAHEVRQDHESYIAERWALLSRKDREGVHEAGLLDAMRLRGIGGTSNWRSVKCLHAHFAHHLAARNRIGALIAAAHGLGPCQEASTP